MIVGAILPTEMLFLTLLLTTMIARTSASNMSNLMGAIQGRDIDKVKKLLNTVDITSKDESGWNVLHAAVYSNGEITRYLISHGADRIVNDHTQPEVSTPLLHGCIITSLYAYPQPNLYEIMEAVLKAGGDPNVSDSAIRKRTPLHYITTGPEARLLISYGADVNAIEKDGYTPASFYFITPFGEKDYEVLYALADSNADFAITNYFGDTIFHMKSNRNPISWTKELVMFLAGNGVPLEALNNRGETALTKLLKRDLLIMNTFGITPDSIMYENLEDSFYAHMVEAGANLSAPNQRGETLLLLAVLNYLEGMAKWLVEKGANVEAKNADGDPLLLALIKQEKRNYVESDYSLPSKGKRDKIMAVVDVLVDGGAVVEFASFYLRKWGMEWLNLKKAESER